MSLFTPLTLPNGNIIANRIAKAAMEENLASAQHTPSEPLYRLYQAWAEGGAGLIISGNVMIDLTAMTGPGGLVLEDDTALDSFKHWAAIGQSRGAQFWLQINHPGRQMPASLGQPTFAPSAVALDLGKMSHYFVQPQAMTEAQIQQVIARFITTAKLAEQAGFSGVQVHAAHGYLLSQFLSPRTNQRNDKWGGSLENRARLLVEVVKGIRAQVNPRFALAVKLNSADFQRGGFSSDDAREVVLMLNQLKVDLVELSGGSYEAPAMQGAARDGRTLAREAYFLEFASELAKAATMPVMVTGGIKRLSVAQQVLDNGVDMVGIATALAISPDLPQQWQQGNALAPELAPITWSNKPLASLANMAMVKYQLRKLSKQQQPEPKVSPIWALLKQQLADKCRTRRYRSWLEKH